MKSAIRRTELLTLCHVLGTVNGQVEPLHLEGRAWEADQQVSDRFRASGGFLPWLPMGTTPAEFKTAVRARARLAGAGLLRIGPAGKTVALTLEGAELARELCLLPKLGEVLCGLDFLADEGNAPSRWSDGSISESSLSGGDPVPLPWTVGEPVLPVEVAGAVVDGMLPLIVEGHVQWRTWGDSTLFLYSLTEHGRELADQRRREGKANPSGWRRLAQRRNDLTQEVYENAWHAVFNARLTAKPLDENIVHHWDPVDPPARGEHAINFSGTSPEKNQQTTTPPNGGKE